MDCTIQGYFTVVTSLCPMTIEGRVRTHHMSSLPSAGFNVEKVQYKVSQPRILPGCCL